MDHAKSVATAFTEIIYKTAILGNIRFIFYATELTCNVTDYMFRSW